VKQLNHPPSKEQVANFYEEHHKHGKYDYLYGDEERRDLLVKLVGKSQRVLDIGCRAGNLTKHYCGGNDVVGVDVDRRALEIFRERLGFEARWLDVDVEPLPFEDASFDVVVFTEVMEHLRFPHRALVEIRRVLKPAGRLIGSVPNAFRLRNRLRFLIGKPFDIDPSHVRLYSAPLVREALERHFQTVEIYPVSGHLLGGGRYGTPVFSWLPFSIRALFCLDLVFLAHTPPCPPMQLAP
jgi:SAM-dependent methyltransferase